MIGVGGLFKGGGGEGAIDMQLREGFMSNLNVWFHFEAFF